MKKGKKAQSSMIIAVFLLVIIMIIIAAGIVIILVKPNLFNPIQQTPTVIIKTVQETPTQPVCNYPYRQVGNTCCIDNDYNFICDSDEIKKQYTASCSYPYIKDGSSCCLDDDGNGLCDMYEYHYIRYHYRHNPRYCHRYYDSNRSYWYNDCD